MQGPIRKIIHIDMDSFYASVEMRDNPSLQGKPVAVGGAIEHRGIICAANYVARKFGIHSAMPTYQAMQLCPKLILIKTNMQKYKTVSRNIKMIMQQYTNLIEPLSLDEAFLDVTNCGACFNSATWIAEEIRNKIYKSQGITASAGISVNKLIAKIASDWNKPNGQFVVAPHMVESFMQKLPINKIFGVGPKTAEKLSNMGIITCADLQNISIETLKQIFGKFGSNLYYLARGIDSRTVNPNRTRKSLSIENTYSKDLTTKEQCIKEINILLEQLRTKLSSNEKNSFNKILIKIKFSDFTKTSAETISSTLNPEKMHNLLIEGLVRGANKPVRLLGVGVRFCAEDVPEQLELL